MARMKAPTLLATLAAAALLSGCEGESPGQPTTAPTNVGGTQPSSPANGSGDVPKVERPLDPSNFLDKPCELVPNDWLRQHGYEDQGDSKNASGPAGPGCAWSTADVTGPQVQVVIDTSNQNAGTGGLQKAFESFERGEWEYFELTSVSGYPAAFTDISDMRSQGRCGISVGIRDDLTFGANGDFFDDDPQKACTEAQALAEQVIKTLQGAG